MEFLIYFIIYLFLVLCTSTTISFVDASNTHPMEAGALSFLSCLPLIGLPIALVGLGVKLGRRAEDYLRERKEWKIKKQELFGRKGIIKIK